MQNVRRLFQEGKWLPRLLLLGFVALGVWLWNGGFFAQTRELYWEVGADRSSIREVEIQLFDLKGNLLKREVLFFDGGAPAAIAQKVALADGDYRARIFVKRDGSPGDEQHAPTIHVEGKQPLLLSLRGSDPAR